MMCFFKPPKIPAPPPIPLPEDSTAARARERKARAGAAGFASTISPETLLGGGNMNQRDTGPKTLLGA